MSTILANPPDVLTSITHCKEAVQVFVNAISNSRDLNFAVRGIRDEAVLLMPLLTKLSTAVKSDACELALGPETQVFLQNCRRLCEKHARSIRLIRQDQITSLKAQLASFKSCLDTLLKLSSFLQTARQDYMTREMVSPILSQFENLLNKQIIDVKHEQTALARYSPPKNDRNRDDILQEVQYQKKTYEAFQKLCEEALKQTVYQRTGQKIFNVTAEDKSVALTGFVNAEQEESRIDQEISGVAANMYSIAVAGVVNKIDYVALAAQMREMR